MMGFRSVLRLEDDYQGYEDAHELKYYGNIEDRFKNIQELIEDTPIIGVLIHECGGITRVEIHKDRVLLSEPTGWKTVKEVGHYYCYGCSDVKEGDI